MLRSVVITLFFLFFSAQTQALEAEFKLIANSNLSTSELTPVQVKALFFKRISYWTDGTPVTLVALKTGQEAHEAFALSVLGTLSYKLDQAWQRAIFSGQANPPIRVENFTALIEKIASTPGAIGYLPTSQRDNRVKTISIKGGTP